MTSKNICPRCRQVIPGEASSGSCPYCLLKMAVVTAPTETLSPHASSHPSPEVFTPPSAAAIDEKFPQLQVLELLGCGGMGAVYRAVQTKLDRAVALKILFAPLAANPVFRERFLREARAMAKLHHPHIVTVFDVGELEEFPYLVMEYVEGATLRDLLDQGRISSGETLRLVPQIYDAMQYAHERGVIHRDIKPANILINDAGQVKIADFGLAKFSAPTTAKATTLTEAGSRMGTTRYMAPEQFADTASADHRADIYALGMLFYEMLTGELPTPDFKPPSRMVSVSRRFDSVIQRSIKDLPDERYQQVLEVKLDVERIVARHRLRWLQLTGVAALLAVAVVLALPYGFPRALSSPAPPPAGLVAQPEAAPRGGNLAVTPTANGHGPRVHPPRDDVPPAASGPPAAAAGLSALLPHQLLTAVDWEWSPPENLGPLINTPLDDNAPCLAPDGLTLIFQSERPGGLGGRDLWISRRAGLAAPWQAPSNLGAPLNSDLHEERPTLGADQRLLSFARQDQRSKLTIWQAYRPASDAAWGGPVRLAEGHCPLLSADGMTLVFAQHGQLMQLTRANGSRPWSEPVPLLRVSDPPLRDCLPCALSSDQCVLVVARKQGPDSSLWMMVRPSRKANWSLPEKLPAPIDSPADEFSATLSAAGEMLVFSSFRPGGFGNEDLWVSRRVPKKTATAAPLAGVEIPADASASQREAAETLFRISRNVAVYVQTVEGREVACENVLALPAEPFRIVGIRLETIDDLPASDIEFLASRLTSVKNAWFHARQTTDDALRMLQRSAELEIFDSRGHDQVTAHGLVHLRQARGLRRLAVAGKTVSDADLCAFPTLTHLKLVDASQIEGSCLRELPELVHLEVIAGRITDQTLKHLPAQKQLSYLNLDRCQQITDEGVAHLAGLAELTFLNLSGCYQLTDRGVQHLAGLKRLAHLELSGTQVSDAGLRHLRELTALKDLYLRGTGITAQAGRSLQEAIPACQIHFQ